MLQLRCRLDLGEESLATHHSRQLWLQHLECDFPIVPEVVGKVDGGHAALSDLSLNGVLTGQRRVQALDDIGFRG